MARLGRLVGIVAAILVAGGVAQQETVAQTDGWTCLPNYSSYGICKGVSELSGIVGLPFARHLSAGCNTGNWSLTGVEIQTGRLPPGLDFDYSTFDIVGVPTRAGSFSFQVLVRGANCEGDTRADFTRNYTIVVTGS